MRLLGANISCEVFDFISKNNCRFSSLETANLFLEGFCGVCDFFTNEFELLQFKNNFEDLNPNVANDNDGAEYGDYQTNESLADSVAKHVMSKGILPEVVIEPTCGKGNFIVAVLRNFKNVGEIIGIEINHRYVWQAKFNIISHFIKNGASARPKIKIHNCSFFDFGFNAIKTELENKNLLIIGNPPWVTSSKLGSLESDNLPHKSNFKNQNGIDAITGKGNFDIAEYITIKLMETFGKFDGCVAFLIKNTVIKNIVFDQNRAARPIGGIEKYKIDAKKEFSVSVDASLLFCRLNSYPGKSCVEYDFYSKKRTGNFGWIDESFVSNIEESTNYIIDGRCQFEWRQGVKHDCSKVMELEKIDVNRFKNKLGEVVQLEDEAVFPLLKSSDLKSITAPSPHKYTIITQHKVGQDTKYLKNLTNTYSYLCDNIESFRSRKSSIYKGKPDFSIFGIGDYSFKPYKVAISGLYKTYHFTLITPCERKPVMLDDTCYFIGFDNLEFAVCTMVLLNSEITSGFLRSISFSDAKRMITKDILMRIDLKKIFDLISCENFDKMVGLWSEKLGLEFNEDMLCAYVNEINTVGQGQLSIF